MRLVVTALILMVCVVLFVCSLHVQMAPPGYFSHTAEQLSVLSMVEAPAISIIVVLEYRSISRYEKEDQS